MKKRILILSLLLTLLLDSIFPIAVTAQESTDVTINGSVTTSYSISVPESINLTSAPSTGTPASTDAFTITVTSNDTVEGGSHHATIKVKGVDGKLSTGGSISLAPALQISSTTLGWNNDPIGADNINSPASLNAITGSAQAKDIIITQPKVETPFTIPSGSYQEILTFTVLFTNS